MIPFRISVAALAAASLSVPGLAQTNSAPQPSPIVDAIPAPRDTLYPGTIRLTVDATDTVRGIFSVKETIPVAASGPLTLLYPQWLPGDHSPTGPIDKLAGLTISAGGKPIAWRRDPVDINAFHIAVPDGARSIDVAFQFLSPTDAKQGRVVVTPEMLNLEWNSVALYPAGFFVRQIMVDASATYPKGWKAATALDIASSGGDTVHYKPVAFDTLVDSPVFAGRYTRTEVLAPGVRLNLVGDTPDSIAATPAQIALHRNLITQAVKLYGAQHYDHYDFLFAMSEKMGGVGLEHHRSSENGVDTDYFEDWDAGVIDRDLLPHEYTHSWNGKFRRPADLWTPDYRTPMQDSLLWVYEGQTQFWGYVLAARSGLFSKQEALDVWAYDAAYQDSNAGRDWRSVGDTTNDPIIAERAPLPWRSWQRSEDYYVEGMFVWLDADSLIREKTGGKKSLDDFARGFFGMRDRDWGELTYTFDDVVAALNRIMPYDWAGFLHARIDGINPRAPLDGFARGGYRLIYTDEPTAYFKAREKDRKINDLSYSIGMVIGEDGAVSSVMWGGAAFAAGITAGTKLVAINGHAFDDDDLKAAIKAAKGGKQPIKLLIEQSENYREVSVQWNGGLRYPRLERIGKGPSTFDALLTAK